MRTITEINELKRNLELVEHYLCEGTEIEFNFVSKLISGEICFVSYKIENELRFAPSRFVGYYNNDLIKAFKQSF